MGGNHKGRQNIFSMKIILVAAAVLAALAGYGGYKAGSLEELSAYLDEAQYYVAELRGGAADIEGLEELPEYSGQPYVTVNGSSPSFDEEMKDEEPYEYFSEMDRLGRCGYAEAKLDRDMMPEEERGSIGGVKPSGWHTVKYEGVDGNYLYNRCHLIAYQLTGQNANEENLITGTRYMNVEGMLPFENEVADYIRETGRQVLYRVTPVYEGSNLVASGVQMEAQSIEDEEICFNVYVFNVQPGIEIDYASGDSRRE